MIIPDYKPLQCTKRPAMVTNTKPKEKFKSKTLKWIEFPIIKESG